MTTINTPSPDSAQTLLVLGSGALQIGQAGEFDYSGSQAIKACKAAGKRVVLINPNIATNQTDASLADAVYFVPVTPQFVERVIQLEKPDGILLAWGGQTALNCGIQLKEQGILNKYNVQVMGTPVDVIQTTEDRQLFNDALDEIGKLYPKSHSCNSLEAARVARDTLGYPVIIRAAFTLGGGGSGFAYNDAEFEELIANVFSFSPQILVEESLKGWKELEYEVVRDADGNCITVCNMENLDPLGIHTGESIVIAPSQTLTNAEYQLLRNVARDVVGHLGVVGECNIQYALDPDDGTSYRIIEVNARLSRSSALASKATGYPLAYVAAEIALGKTLPEIDNRITQQTKAMFEPALDYVALKIPRWDLGKFRKVSEVLGSEMKSVGEVMALGRSFPEVLQKGLRMLQQGALGVAHSPYAFTADELELELDKPTPRRIFALYQALQQGYTVDQLHDRTRVDRWFLSHLLAIHHGEQAAVQQGTALLDNPTELKRIKQLGFSDAALEKIWSGELTEQNIRTKRIAAGVKPVTKQVDTLAGEFPAQTNYLYTTYHGTSSDIAAPTSRTALVLGSGPYAIGSSVEFDWCCVQTVKTLRDNGYQVAMLNSNPETVSTDYEECDLLYFDELSLERVQDVFDEVSPEGIIVYAGGQVPNNLAPHLGQLGLPIIGTPADMVDKAEDRSQFGDLCDKLGIDQPEWQAFSTPDQATAFADQVGYPVLVRPSKVLSGAAMAVAHTQAELHDFLGKAAKIDTDAPVVVSKFELNSRELEFDGVAHNGEVILYAISEHIENAGVHSGDAHLVFPPQRTYLETIRRLKTAAKSLAKELNITGPFNMQFLARDNMIKVIELNLRSSRSFPFVSKITGINFIEVATRAALGDVDTPEYRRQHFRTLELDHVGVKAPQFSFSRLRGADPVLSVEMASTGEVGCFGHTFAQAYLLSLLSTGFRLPQRGVLLSLGGVKAKADLVDSARDLQSLGLALYATPGTARALTAAGVTDITELPKLHDDDSKSLLQPLKSGNIDLVINIPNRTAHEDITDGYHIRRAAIDGNIPLMTNAQLVKALVQSLREVGTDPMALPVQMGSKYVQ